MFGCHQCQEMPWGMMSSDWSCPLTISTTAGWVWREARGAPSSDSWRPPCSYCEGQWRINWTTGLSAFITNRNTNPWYSLELLLLQEQHEATSETQRWHLLSHFHFLPQALLSCCQHGECSMGTHQQMNTEPEGVRKIWFVGSTFEVEASW